MIDLIPSLVDALLGPLGAALGAIAAVAGAWLAGRRSGTTRERLKAQRKDFENAREIERRADRIRAALDGRTPDQRLRDHDGALRD